MSNFSRKMNKNETISIKKEMEKVEKDFYKDQREIYLKSPLNRSLRQPDIKKEEENYNSSSSFDDNDE